VRRAGEPASNVTRDEIEECDRLFFGSGELRAKRRVLRRDSYRTGVLVALSRVDATQRNQ